MPRSGQVFDTVCYYLSTTIPANDRDNLAAILDARGASAATSPDASVTHFITNTLALEDSLESLPPGSTAALVTPLWAERSAVLDSLQDPEYYSPDPTLLFSGVTAAAADLSAADTELMSAAISALGGQWRAALTKDVTHLFALAPGSQKYTTALHFQPSTRVRVLVPHWFDDSVRLGVRGLPTDAYEWPTPRVFKPNTGGRSAEEDLAYEPPKERQVLYETAELSGATEQPKRSGDREVWKGRKLLLGYSLDLSANQRRALYADIRRQGGEVVELPTRTSNPEDEAEKVEEADIFVTKYRAGPAYMKAYKLRKTIGTLAWLWYVRASGHLSRPADQLLHYPVPDRPPEGFDKEVITVTNYTGKDREYLKKLITVMGGEFTASMAAERNTIVVAAYIGGTKTDKATSWSIPIVNHSWVEDCFVQWRRLTPATERYIVFPPGVDFSTLLAARGLGKIAFDEAQLEAIDRMDVDPPKSAPTTPAKQKPKSTAKEKEKPRSSAKERTASPEKVREKPTSRKPVSGKGKARELLSAESMGDVLEVEDAVDTHADASDGAEMDIDADFGAPPDDDDGMDIDQSPSAKRKARSEKEREKEGPRKKLVRRFQARNSLSGRDDVDDSRADPEMEMPAPSPAKPARTYGSAKTRHAVDSEASGDEQPAKSPTKRKQPATRAPPSRKRDAVDVESESESDAPPPKSKARKAAPVTSDSELEDVRTVLHDLITNHKSKPQSPTKGQRMDSVLVPSVSSVVGSAKKSRARSPKRTSRKNAHEAAVSSPQPKRKQSTSKAAKPARPAAPSENEPSDAEPELPKAKTKAKATPAKARRSAGDHAEGSAAATRSPSKRPAATKASDRLHNEIMPDLVSFQRELKNGSVKGAGDGEASVRGKGKKRPSTGTAADGGDSEGGLPEKKRRKTGESAATAKKKDQRRKSMAESETEEEEAAETGARGAGASKTDPKSVRIMTTQLTLSEDVVKVLTKLGCKVVTKPAECTHLIVRSAVRTEKFLCAMAVAPFVLNEKWALASAASKKLLPEENYVIKDDDTEEKYGFQLAASLRRAKKNAGKLFAGCTFYVTPKVPVDTKLLKAVVSANGGSLSTQTPTVRILKGHDNRHVVSTANEISIWRPIAEGGFKIYTQELILTSALRQEIDWDEEAYQVEGSF